MSWCDELKVGDKVSYHINEDYRRTGEVKTFIVDSEELLNYIKHYESEDNYHNMKIIL